jgi:hypothetical protein
MEREKFLQFYADKKDCYKNKLFCFKIDNLMSAFRLLLNFHCKGNSYRLITIRTSDIPRNFDTDTYVLLADYHNFFKEYDSSHFPSLTEAYNDFKMSLL